MFSRCRTSLGTPGQRGLQGIPGPKGPKVLFGAIKSTSEWHGNFCGLYITYNELVVNKGSGFDAASGTFTATQVGVLQIKL